MGKHWAIAVGINQYQKLNRLPYAANDAAAFVRCFRNAMTPTHTYLLSDVSPEVILDGGAALPGLPTFANLKQFLQLRFSTPFLEPDDTLWFLFSGHGLQFANRDYLMCLDSEPNQADQTAISVDDLVTCLRRGGTDNVVLLLDACRTDYQSFGQGFGTDPEDVITIFASNFAQQSQSVTQLKQGLFTHTWIETLRSLKHSNDCNLGHLYHLFCAHMAKLNQQYNQALQVPRLKADFPLSLNTIPLPILKNDSAEIPAPILAKQRMEELTLRSMTW